MTDVQYISLIGVISVYFIAIQLSAAFLTRRILQKLDELKGPTQ